MIPQPELVYHLAGGKERPAGWRFSNGSGYNRPVVSSNRPPWANPW
ncbi:MAG: hypothetical protein OEV94_00460 [Deltaproteobacteria bacterium]|nr:hypothetical protein [Deltaproteobacteria bacterium]